MFAESARSLSGLVPTVWIGTIRANGDGKVDGQLALSPRVANTARVGVIVRFDDAFTRVWGAQSDSAITMQVGASLRAMLRAAESSGVSVAEVQLDYDCPERLLPRWSAVVARLTSDALADRSVWVTSLVTHMRRRDYGDLFRGHVSGHILQVFDTGDRMSLSHARQIERNTSRQRMPFRLGVAAFERRLANGRATDHAAWFSAEGVMGGSTWYRGLWVFPGGRSWVALLRREQ